MLFPLCPTRCPQHHDRFHYQFIISPVIDCISFPLIYPINGWSFFSLDSPPYWVKLRKSPPLRQQLPKTWPQTFLCTSEHNSFYKSNKVPIKYAWFEETGETLKSSEVMEVFYKITSNRQLLSCLSYCEKETV